MAAMKYFVPALAVAGRAAAQCSVAATSTIQNAGDASALASCSTFSGSIAIATGTTGEIAIDGVQEITGSLSATNVEELTGITGDSLETIGGTFNLDTVQILSTLNFPRLTDVRAIEWNALAGLQGLVFTSGIQMASTLSIQNTQLNTLDGINLQTAETVYIANNDYLNDITMQIGNVSDSLVLTSNGRNVSANFPNLIWGNVMTFRNCSTVSVPSLASTNGSLGFYSNFFQSLVAPNLTMVGGDLSFANNDDMTNITMPQLQTVTGGLQIANNTELNAIGFSSLETVGGAVSFVGSYETVSLPELSNVRGAFRLASTSDISSACTKFRAMHGNSGVIRGNFVCRSGSGSSGTSTSNGDDSSDGGSSSSSSSGSSSSSTDGTSGASTVYVSGATALMGVVAAIFGML